MSIIKKIDCPFCGEPCLERKWYEDARLVETDIQCKCGYHYSDSYGIVEIIYPEEETIVDFPVPKSVTAKKDEFLHGLDEKIDYSKQLITKGKTYKLDGYNEYAFYITNDQESFNWFDFKTCDEYFDLIYDE